MVLGVWQNWESLNVGEAFLVALIAIVIVFLVLGIIIFITWSMQKGMEKIDASQRKMLSTLGFSFLIICELLINNLTIKQ